MITITRSDREVAPYTASLNHKSGWGVQVVGETMAAALTNALALLA